MNDENRPKQLIVLFTTTSRKTSRNSIWSSLRTHWNFREYLQKEDSWIISEEFLQWFQVTIWNVFMFMHFFRFFSTNSPIVSFWNSILRISSEVSQKILLNKSTDFFQEIFCIFLQGHFQEFPKYLSRDSSGSSLKFKKISKIFTRCSSKNCLMQSF